MNREQRRKAEKEQRHLDSINRTATRGMQIMVHERNMTAAIQQIQRNGITMKDLDNEYDRGYSDGFDKGYDLSAENTLKSLYSCLLMTLKEELHFGHDRALKLLKDLDSKVMVAYDEADLKAEVWDKLGINFDFRDPIERVSESGAKDAKKSESMGA